MKCKYTYKFSFRIEPSLPREGPLAKNNILNDAEQMYKGHLIGPESIASKEKNEIFVSLANGDIVRVWGEDFEKSKVVGNLGPGGCGKFLIELFNIFQSLFLKYIL